MKQGDKNLDQFVQSLPREIQPSQDLWPRIERALDDLEGRKHKPGKQMLPRYWIQAAAILILLVTGTLLFIKPDQPGNKVDIAALSRLFEDQKQNLLISYKDVPALTGNWIEQLQELEDAADTISASLEENPNNTVLLGMLKQVYMQQLDLIQTVHQTDYRSI